MEFLLRWADDLDDAVGVLRHLAPRIAAVIAALALLLFGTVALLLAAPFGLVLAAAAIGVCLLELFRRRRSDGTSQAELPVRLRH